MNNQSISDLAVETLAEVRSIGRDINIDHPMRFVVRSMRETAMVILSDAMRNASSIARQAEQLIEDYDETKKEPQ